MPKALATRQDSFSMSVRAAWLHYAGGHTQAEVAKKMGLTSLKAHRLITKANNDGLVKVYIDGDIAECVALENQLAERYDLHYCEVVPDLEEGELPLRALGIAGAHYLKRVIESTEHEAIGIGHGRTLASCVNMLPKLNRPDKDIVSLLGGFSKKFSANPYDVIHLLAQRTATCAYVMPVPFFVNSKKDKAVIIKQYGIKEVMDRARQTSVKIAGIGCVDVQSTMVANGMLEAQEIQAIHQAGGCGEILGHFFDAQGMLVNTELSERTMGLSAKDIAASEVIAVAGGNSKIQAIRSILTSGLLNGLITDERTACALVDVES